jgi:ribosomal protein L16 Arg81 hydroxylase
MDSGSILPLQRLINPTTTDIFWKDIFEKKQLLSKGPGLLKDFTESKFEQLLWAHESLVRVRIVFNKAGKSVYYNKAEAGKDKFRWAIDRYMEGCTIIFNGIDDIDPEVAKQVRPLDKTFKGKTTANAFLTPPNSKGFLPHFDTHDVFIVQTSGTKKWVLYQKEMDLPLDNQIYLIDQDKLETPVAEYLLEPGDVLYIPRGMVHGSFTEDEHSLHITVGIRPLLGVDYMNKMLETLSENDVSFRKSIAGMSSEEMIEESQKLLGKLQSGINNPYFQKLTTEKIDMRLASQKKPLPGHHLNNLEKIDKLNLNSKVVKAYPHNDALVDSGSNIRLVFSGTGFSLMDNPRPGFIEFPAIAYGALNFIRKTGEPFMPKDLSAFYSDENKLVIVKELLKEGYLKFV